MPVFSIGDLQAYSTVFNGKYGNVLVKGLMKALCISRINELYDRYKALGGPDFTDAVLKDLGVKYEIRNWKVINSLNNSAFITISNHPYGGIDGLILVDFLGRFRPDYKVMVNRILKRIVALDNNFIDVIPTGRKRVKPEMESIQGVRTVLKHVEAGHPVGIFPSGAISDFKLRNWCVEDRQWQKPVIRLIKKMRVPIMPVGFLGGNSALFYSLGLLDWRVRLLKLPSELFNKRNKTVQLVLGDIIMPEQQDDYPDIDAFGQYLRENVYKLKKYEL